MLARTSSSVTRLASPRNLRWQTSPIRSAVREMAGQNAFQMRAVLSEAVTTRLPSRLKLADLTTPPCVIASPTALPVSASQMRAVLSSDAVTTRLPSGLKLADLTTPPCVIASPTALPVSASQMRAVLSPEVGVLRMVNDSPDAPALSVTPNGDHTAPLGATVAYEGSTGYDVNLVPGVNDLAIAPAGNLTDILAAQAVEVRPNSAYTLYALGPLAQLFALVTFDDYRRYATQARLRFIQGSPSATSVDVYLTASGTGIEGATPTYAALPFAADTGFVSYVQGIYDLTVTDAGSKTPIIGPIATWLDDGEISTLVVRDAPGGGPPYGLIGLDDGLLPASLGE